MEKAKFCMNQHVDCRSNSNPILWGFISKNIFQFQILQLLFESGSYLKASIIGAGTVYVPQTYANSETEFETKIKTRADELEFYKTEFSSLRSLNLWKKTKYLHLDVIPLL